MSAREISHLLISTITLSVAFGIALAGGAGAFGEWALLLESVLISFIAVSLGFFAHEMAHRVRARKSGLHAEYYMSVVGLGLALAVSLTGWILAAPGAVRIYGQTDDGGTASVDKKEMGKISIAGPLANLILVPVFFLLGIAVTFAEGVPGEQALLWKIALFGIQINAWLALLNLLPFGPFDGAKVISWSKPAWVAATVAAAGLYLVAIL